MLPRLRQKDSTVIDHKETMWEVVGALYGKEEAPWQAVLKSKDHSGALNVEKFLLYIVVQSGTILTTRIALTQGYVL
jgi:hypothetical protein